MSGLEPLRNTPERLTAGDIPGLARVVAVSSFRIGSWAALTGVNAARRMADVALHPAHAAELAEDIRVAASAVTRALVGDQMAVARQSATETLVHNLTSNPVIRVVTDTLETVSPPTSALVVQEMNPLQAAGQDLLRRSRDVWADDLGHPAYARIVEELAPDESRILHLLFTRGPQASVDVRTGGMIGTVSSMLVKAQLTMIGAHAGCRYVDRVPSYLHNLERLGLVWFSSELVTDPMDYQVLEAQPDVLEAMHSVRRAKSVRRSIHLTPFGEDFCRDGLGLHLSQEQIEAGPKHTRPKV